MNLLSSVSPLWIFYVPVIYKAGGYFDFQPYPGMVMTFIVAGIQSLVIIFLKNMNYELLIGKTKPAPAMAFALLFSVALPGSASSWQTYYHIRSIGRRIRFAGFD